MSPEQAEGRPVEARSASSPWAPWSKRGDHNFFRSVDYLVTRPEIDKDRIGYYSLSMGAFFGPIPVALEPRVKVAVLASGGLRFNYPPEIQPANFAPHVKVPVLLVNGRNDFQAPVEAQLRLRSTGSTSTSALSNRTVCGLRPSR